jgi:CRISPR-associated protein Cas2
MARRRFLVTYDVTDDKRRTKVFKTLRGAGDHVQFSVFLCDLNERERTRLRGQLDAVIDHRQDQILTVDLGPSDSDPDQRISSLGRAYERPVPVIVV